VSSDLLSEMKNDSKPNSIPTIVNGQVNQITEINNKNHMINKLNDIQKLLSETDKQEDKLYN
jgi:hypothetical protein